ncbi:MAG: sulfite exporter TauE/SafE family protein [Betaproteobacteria bacterium]|nr:sulfite exporter TauE/SafE family protein [Betaproteobacteria bacterium]
MPELSAAEWVFAGGAVFFAAIVRGFTGFGFSALCVALLSFMLPPPFAVPLVMLMEVAASAQLLPGAWRHVDFRWLLPVCAGVVLGTPFGVWLLVALDVETAAVLVYGALAVLAAAHFFGAGRVLSAPPFVVGIFAGAVNGLAAVAGLAAALFLLATKKPETARASLIALFFAGDLYALFWDGGMGLLRPAHGVLFLGLILPLAAGVFIGGRLFVKTGGRNYKQFSAALILCAAAGGLLRFVFGANG